MYLHLRAFTSLLSVIAVCVLGQSAYSKTLNSQSAFSVRNSIEMNTFSDPFTRSPGAIAKEAPDGSGFVVITTRGHIESNKLESCVWYFSRKVLEAYLSHKNIPPPRPRLLLKRLGTPMARQSNSYGSLISVASWSPDSRSLLLLVEEARGYHHLYRVAVTGNSAVDLTPQEEGDVSAPVMHGNTLAYLLSVSQGRTPNHAEEPAKVVTGKSLFSVLMPEEHSDLPGMGVKWKLKVQSPEASGVFPEDKSIFFPVGAAGIFQPRIAPNGRSVVVAAPVENVPAAWSAYWSGFVTRRFVPSTPSSDRSGRDLFWPWQYSLLDLKSKKITPLFDASTGYVMSAGSVYEAKWSPSGNEIVATYTYLPLDPARQYAPNSVKPCAIAEYSVKMDTTVCLKPAEAFEQSEKVLSVDYDSSGAVVAHFDINGSRLARRYDRASRRWLTIDEAVNESKSMVLYIQQDIDEPPTLWIRTGKEERLLWDANPQFKRMRFSHATPYKWTDSSGYTWRGGLVLPSGPLPPGGYPLVIQTHGYYNDHEFLVDGAFTTASAAQPLACVGIAVLQMEDRAGRHFRPAAEEANDEVRGIESAIDQLAREQLIDPSRVGIEGFSRTSWYVETAIEHAPLRYKAAILSDGVDMSYVQDVLIVPGSDEARSEMEGPYGVPPFGQGLAEWIKKATGFNLDKITAPIRIEAHGAISLLCEWEMYSILLQQKKPVDLIWMPRGQHVLQQPAERYESQQGAVDWFRFWLQGYRRHSTEMDPVYQRWGSMAKPTIQYGHATE